MFVEQISKCIGNNESQVSYCLKRNVQRWKGGFLVVKNLPASAGDARDVSSIPGSGRSPGVGIDNPLQSSCLENPHGQRSLAGYSPWGHKELDVTEHSTQENETGVS